MSCEHDAVELSAPLEHAIDAALRLRLDLARGIDEATIARQITWAVWATGNITSSYRTSASACAAMRRHPDLVQFADPTDEDQITAVSVG